MRRLSSDAPKVRLNYCVNDMLQCSDLRATFATLSLHPVANPGIQIFHIYFADYIGTIKNLFTPVAAFTVQRPFWLVFDSYLT